ncbi:MAG: phage holin family protein [Pseudomonadota bacterium]
MARRVHVSPIVQSPGTDQDPVHASARVIEGAVALVRAELRLVTSEVRARAVDAAVGVALAVSAVAVGQVALLLLALSPALAAVQPWPVVLGMVAVPVVLALAIAAVALRRMRSPARPLGDSHGSRNSGFPAHS